MVKCLEQYRISFTDINMVKVFVDIPMKPKQNMINYTKQNLILYISL